MLTPSLKILQMLCGHLLLFITYCKHHDYSQRPDVLSHQITPAKTKKFPCSLFCLPCRVFRSAQPKSPCAFGTTKSNRHPPHLHNAFAAQLPFQGIKKKCPFYFIPCGIKAESGKSPESCQTSGKSPNIKNKIKQSMLLYYHLRDFFSRGLLKIYFSHRYSLKHKILYIIIIVSYI